MIQCPLGDTTFCIGKPEPDARFKKIQLATTAKLIDDNKAEFHMQVCPVEESWVAPLLDKIHDVDVVRLSKGTAVESKEAAGELAALEPKAVEKMLQRKNDDSKVIAAKERFLARKKARMR